MIPRVRDLTLEEGSKPRLIGREGQNVIEFHRAQSVLARYRGNTPPRIAVITLASEDAVRGVIRAFNEHGMAMLQREWDPDDPPSSPTTNARGRSPSTSVEPRTRICPTFGGRSHACESE